MSSEFKYSAFCGYCRARVECYETATDNHITGRKYWKFAMHFRSNSDETCQGADAYLDELEEKSIEATIIVRSGTDSHQSASLPPDAEKREPTPPAEPTCLPQDSSVVRTEPPFTAAIGRKFDGGKDDWSLMPFQALREILHVLMLGAKKYDRDNWKIVPDAENRYRNAAMRHLVAILSGEERDPETGLLHAAHLGCNALFMIWFSLRKTEA